ncbi:unnamed protein product [Ceutorhynchus assimilis]|uniref:glutathione transferase n=1 Tax=Ceutorhynchus assimilis TaxID=467358 RepID=A0A9N9N202_9CUCU|nr:unnamed protein product [Ceutorhynchus assimilis]
MDIFRLVGTFARTTAAKSNWHTFDVRLGATMASTKPKYRLTYFTFTGLAEPTRLLFAYGGIEYEDVRISQADWPKFKKSMPIHLMPVLEIDGKIIHQSLAMARYVAKQVGLTGDNDLEACEIDMKVDTLNDYRLKILEGSSEADPVRKARLKEKLDKETLPFLLGKLDTWVKESNGYFANNKLSWADLYFFAISGFLDVYHGRELLPGYPNLQALRETVSKIPAIKAWVEKRPPDNYTPYAW